MERAEVSKTNKYWIEKHRFYELKHFCRQYRYWKKVVSNIDGMVSQPIGEKVSTSGHSDPTIRAAFLRELYESKIKLIERIADETDPVVSSYILKGVTEGKSYDVMNALETLPCSRDEYYRLYRKFFWLLHKARI